MKHFTLILIALLMGLASNQRGYSQTEKPNIIVINLDDADSEMLNDENLASRYPNLNRLANEGLRFTNLHVVNPLCGPSRACLLRGQYSHQIDILVNQPSASISNGLQGGFAHYMDQGYFDNDLSTWMQTAGYRTMMLGKFLHGDVRPFIPPGWDDFYHSLGARYFATYRFTNRTRESGRWETLPDDVYRTIAERDDMVQLIRTQSARENPKPFFMYLNPLTPHASHGGPSDSMIEDRFASWWRTDMVPRSKDFNVADTSDKTGPLSQLEPLRESSLDYVDGHYRDRARAMKSFDLLLGSLFQTLENESLDNTFIFLTSDNGYSLGHHRYVGKALPLDRIAKVPLIVWGPDVPQGQTADHLLAHIDLTSTVVDLAGGAVPEFVSGKSFKPLIFDPQLTEPGDWRSPVLIESYIQVTTVGTREDYQAAYSALRLHDELYIEYATGGKEHYNLADDPNQLNNVYESLTPAFKHYLETTLRELKQPVADPAASISFPSAVGQTISRRATLSGLAFDDRGINAGRLALFDINRRQFWNGSEWQDQFNQITIPLSNRRGTITEWTYRPNFPKAIAPEGRVKAWVWSFDTQGQYSVAPAVQEFVLDQEPPTVEITIPDEDAAEFLGSVRLEGLASDNLDVSEVQLIIRDQADGRYWNGTELQTEWSAVGAELLSRDRWRFKQTLPQGEYLVFVRSIDDSRNVSATLARRTIVVY